MTILSRDHHEGFVWRDHHEDFFPGGIIMKFLFGESVMQIMTREIIQFCPERSS